MRNSRIPITAGTLYTRLSRPGLYHARERRSIPRGTASARAPVPPFSRAKAWTTRVAYPSATVAVLEWVPSTITCTRAGRAAARSAAKPAGTSIATTAAPLSSAAGMSADRDDAPTTSNLPVVVNASTSRREATLASLSTTNVAVSRMSVLTA